MFSDKLNYYFSALQGWFNSRMRLLFPRWNQKIIDELTSDPRQQVFVRSQQRTQEITGKRTAGQLYVMGLLSATHAWAVANQWLVNQVDLEQYPLSTTLYIMYKYGSLTEGQYRFHRAKCLDEDEAWMDGFTAFVPSSAPNYLDSLDETLALRNEMLKFS